MKADGDESLRDLAEQEMEDKREEMGSEEQARELYDVPTEPPVELGDQQEDEGGRAPR